MSMEFQFAKVKKSWRQMLMIDAQRECTECHSTVHLKMFFKMVNFRSLLPPPPPPIHPHPHPWAKLSSRK